jgi:Putative auto-transporter adhesin, head GIN domain
MKNLRALLVAIFILGISACTNGQIRKTVRGDHHVVTKERSAESFTGIQVSSGIDVYLKQGNKETISVEADENLHEYIITKVVGDNLKVYTDVNIRSAERKRVYVTVREIDYIKTSSAGDVYGETPVKSDRIDLSASSAGDIKLEIYAKEIEINISSSGDMTLSGETDVLKVDLSSAGDLNAYDLVAREANISVSSAGDADINVSEKLTARASSAGDINYKGNPKYVDSHSSSAGSIHKR